MSNKNNRFDLTDAKILLDQFKELNPNVDNDAMLTWFLNSVIIGYDNATRRYYPAVEALKKSDCKYYPVPIPGGFKSVHDDDKCNKCRVLKQMGESV